MFWTFTRWSSVGLVILSAAAVFAITPRFASAQHQDVVMSVSDGQIVTHPSGSAPVWTDFLLAPGFPPMAGPPPVQQDDPGFNAPAGSFAPSSLIGLNVAQPLWYWDGEMIAIPPDGTVFELENALSEFVTVDSSAPPAPSSFDFAVAGDEGGIHQHILFSLPDPISPDGAYGIVLELTAPNREASDPFLIVFNQQLPSDQFNLGVQAILDATGILAPEFLPGDYNDNGMVEQADLDLVLLNWGEDGSTPPGGWVGPPPEGSIDQAELDGVLLHWGTTLASVSGSAGVPEPNANVLLVLAASISSMAVFQRRNRVNLKGRG